MRFSGKHVKNDSPILFMQSIRKPATGLGIDLKMRKCHPKYVNCPAIIRVLNRK